MALVQLRDENRTEGLGQAWTQERVAVSLIELRAAVHPGDPNKITNKILTSCSLQLAGVARAVTAKTSALTPPTSLPTPLPPPYI